MHIPRRHLCHAAVRRPDVYSAHREGATEISRGGAHGASARGSAAAGGGQDDERSWAAAEHFDEDDGIAQVRNHAESRFENDSRVDSICRPYQTRLILIKIHPALRASKSGVDSITSARLFLEQRMLTGRGTSLLREGGEAWLDCQLMRINWWYAFGSCWRNSRKRIS